MSEIDFDAKTASITSTTGLTSWTFSHTPSGTPKGIVVMVVHPQSTTDYISGITYGGQALTRLQTAVDTATERGRSDIWFLGTGVPSGTQDVVASFSSNFDLLKFQAVTLVTDDGSDTEVLDSDLLQEDQADPSVTLTYSGRVGIAFAALYGGGIAPTSFTPNANCTAMDEEDFGSTYAKFIRQTTPGTSDFAIGGTAALDDVAYVAAAFAKVAASNATGSASLAVTATVDSAGVYLQVLAPSADSADGSWTDDGGGTALAAAIDESTPSDTDYIQSDLAPSTSGCRVKLASSGDPLSSVNHQVRWRVGKNTTGGDTINVTVKLIEGGGDVLGAGTVIASFARNNVDSLTTYTETLSGAEADSITDYSDLYLEFYADTA